MKRDPADADASLRAKPGARPGAKARPVAAPGLERRILARLPEAAIGGSLIAGLFAASAHFFPPDGSITQVEKHVRMMDAIAIGAGILLWTLVVTVAIGCVVVMVMKGPVHTADSYPVPDRDRPPPRD